MRGTPSRGLPRKSRTSFRARRGQAAKEKRASSVGRKWRPQKKERNIGFLTRTTPRSRNSSRGSRSRNPALAEDSCAENLRDIPRISDLPAVSTAASGLRFRRAAACQCARPMGDWAVDSAATAAARVTALPPPRPWGENLTPPLSGSPKWRARATSLTRLIPGRRSTACVIYQGWLPGTSAMFPRSENERLSLSPTIRVRRA